VEIQDADQWFICMDQEENQMSLRDKKILLWTGTGNNQRALAHKMAGQFNLCGIIVDHKRTGKKISFFKRAWPALADRIFFKRIRDAWFSMQARYGQQYSNWPTVPVKDVDSINSEESYTCTLQFAPDLIVVSGTALVKAKMLSIKPPIGIINLHTGLSPYIKGGPNCTNWCISTGQFDKIGNTIMWINEGIDSGNIISTELTPLNDRKSLNSVHWQVMEHAHDLYLRSIAYLLQTKPPYQSVAQKDIAKGELYLTRMWNNTAKRNLLKNWKKFANAGKTEQNPDIITIPLK
jgi:folate-dependent phosphoribosylglycinamide formyltransferase PurN